MASSPGPISLSVSYPGQITLQISLDQLFTCNSAQSHGLQPRPDQSLASSRCHSHFFVCLANPAHTQVDDLHPNTNPGPISLSLHQDVTLIFRLSCQSCTHRWMTSIHNTNPGQATACRLQLSLLLLLCLPVSQFLVSRVPTGEVQCLNTVLQASILAETGEAAVSTSSSRSLDQWVI